MSKKSGTKGVTGHKEEEICKVCKKENEDDRWIQCDVCANWNHAACAALDDNEYEALKKGGRKVKWLCRECDIPHILETLKVLKEIKAKNDKLEKDLSELKNEVSSVTKKLNEEIGGINKKLSDTKSKFDKQMEGVRNDIEKLVQKKVDAKMQETDEILVKTVEKKVEDHLAAVTNNITAVRDSIGDVKKDVVDVKKDVDEQKEREQRAPNMIIYNIPESALGSLQERIDHDQHFCIDTFYKVLKVKVDAGDIKKTVRLGKKVESGGHRPLLIQFRDRIFKNMVMESLSALKGADEPYKKLIFAHDLTIRERAECKKLVAEAKEEEQKDSSGEYLYRVRGVPGSFRIVKIKKR